VGQQEPSAAGCVGQPDGPWLRWGSHGKLTVVAAGGARASRVGVGSGFKGEIPRRQRWPVVGGEGLWSGEEDEASRSGPLMGRPCTSGDHLKQYITAPTFTSRSSISELYHPISTSPSIDCHVTQ
jgi:hypothetical protein